MSADAQGASKTSSLESVSLPRLLFALLRNRFVGTLTVPQPEPAGLRTVWVRGGMPVFTDWVSPGDVLGSVLLDAGDIAADDHNRALGTMASDGGLLGQILLQQGSLSQEQLTEALRRQCLRKMTHIFALRSGDVEIVAEDHDLGKDDGLAQLNVLELVRKGVATHYDVARARNEMGPQYMADLATSKAFDRYKAHFRFRPDDEEALAALTRGSTIDTIATLPGMSEGRAATLMFTLWACQMLREASDARASQPLPPHRAPKPAPAKPAAPRAPKPAAPAPKPEPAAPAAKPAPTPARAPTGPRASAPDAPEDGGAAFLADLEELEERIAGDAHAFKLVGIPIESTRSEVRGAWSDLAKRFHPDGLKGQGLGHLHDRVERVFAALSEANLVLSDKEKREELRYLVEAGGDDVKGSQDATAMARAVFESELEAKDGDKLLRAGKFPQALVHYERAIELNPDEPDLQAALLWCRFNVQGEPRDQAGIIVQQLDAISREYPAVARAHYFRGLLLLKAGSDQIAIGAFEAAFKADPRLIDAQRQARAIRMRLNPPKPKDEGKGLFGRLFKK